MRAEQVTDPHADLGEGPVWWEPWGGLKYVDLLAGDVLSLQEDGGVSRVHVGRIAAALRPRVGGGAVIGTERAFALASRDDLSDAAPLGDLWSDGDHRFNDGGCAPDGSFYCGTMAYDEAPGQGVMYRLAPEPGGVQEAHVERVWDHVTISNGFGFSPDGTQAYYNDTPTRRTDVFDYDAASGPTGRRPLVTLGDDVAGNPDGLCVDAEGFVWVALWNGGAVHRYSPTGSLDGVVEVSVSRPTACTFGGPDLATLYITTSHVGIPEGEETAAGSLFACRPGVRGLPTLPFRG